MTFVNCFSKSINPISRLPIPRRVTPRALLAAKLCDNWQLIAQVSPTADLSRVATSPGQQQAQSSSSSSASRLTLVFCLFRIFAQAPAFLVSFGFVLFRYGSMRFGSLLSRQSGCLVLDWRDDWWRKCNRHRLHEAACLARGAPTRLGTWMRQAVPLCALCCTLHAACCMVYGAVVSVPDVEPWGCWRLTVSLIGRFLLYAAFWQMTNHNERLSYTFNWHLPSVPPACLDRRQLWL